MPVVLAGDIGGTKTVLALFAVTAGKFAKIAEERYDSRRYKKFDNLLTGFLAQYDSNLVKKAVFAVPGVIVNGICKTTNLPWKISAARISKQFKIPRVALVNDFEAISYSASLLKKSDVIKLFGPKPEISGTKAIIGAGTGLGMSILAWDGHCHSVLASEGGHCDFAPQTELEWKLKKFVKNSDWESVLSGKGLVNIYDFLKKHGIQESRDVHHAFLSFDKSEVISMFSFSDVLCKKAMQLFVKIYGSAAGNLALVAKATGGVYLAGGIAPKILKHLFSSDFKNSFVSHNRMKVFLKKIPVFVIKNESAGLWGAAYLAAEL